MKMIKLIIPFILIFALAFPTYAMHLTEDKVIDRELTVEKDENVVDNSINGVSKERPSKTFIMSLPVYLKRAVLPFLMLFSLGPICLALECGIKEHKRKSHSQ